MPGLAEFREVWVIDTEFRAPPGERPDPVCMVGREYHSGRTFRLFRDDLRRRLTAPFTDPKGAPMFRQIAGMAGEVRP